MNILVKIFYFVTLSIIANSAIAEDVPSFSYIQANGVHVSYLNLPMQAVHIKKDIAKFHEERFLNYAGTGEFTDNETDYWREYKNSESAFDKPKIMKNFFHAAEDERRKFDTRKYYYSMAYIEIKPYDISRKGFAIRPLWKIRAHSLGMPSYLDDGWCSIGLLRNEGQVLLPVKAESVQVCMGMTGLSGNTSALSFINVQDENLARTIEPYARPKGVSHNLIAVYSGEISGSWLSKDKINYRYTDEENKQQARFVFYLYPKYIHLLDKKTREVIYSQEIEYPEDFKDFTVLNQVESTPRKVELVDVPMGDNNKDLVKIRLY